jgi:hypothetical protein
MIKMSDLYFENKFDNIVLFVRKKIKWKNEWIFMIIFVKLENGHKKSSFQIMNDVEQFYKIFFKFFYEQYFL